MPGCRSKLGARAWQLFTRASDVCRRGSPVEGGGELRASESFDSLTRPSPRGHCKRRGVLYTKFAEPYPRKLWELLFLGYPELCRPYTESQEVERIGEAANPGPRISLSRSVLDEIELLQPATVTLRSRYWQLFANWAVEQLGAGALLELLKAPNSLRGGSQSLWTGTLQ